VILENAAKMFLPATDSCKKLLFIFYQGTFREVFLSLSLQRRKNVNTTIEKVP